MAQDGLKGKFHHHCATETGDYDCALSKRACINSAHNKTSDNPLNDPVVRSSLYEAKLSDCELINMTVKELNKRLAHCPAQVVNKLKRCRRTLKNRGYAKNCRIKRIAGFRRMQQMIEQKDQVIAAKNRLIEQLQQRLRSLQPPSCLAPPPPSCLAPPPTKEVGGDTASAYVHQQNHHLNCDGHSNYQQLQWQQREPMEQVNCGQQQNCGFRPIQEAEMSYAHLLDQVEPLEDLCHLDQQHQMVDGKRPSNEIIMTTTANYVEWMPASGHL